MKIPAELHVCPTTFPEVEARLAREGAPDLWLQQWHKLANSAELGDELCEYHELAFPLSGNDDWGYALLCDGEVVDAISTYYFR